MGLSPSFLFIRRSGMGKLTNLLKWKKAIAIKDEKGLAARDEDGNPVIIYMRVIGDKDLEDASAKARFISALKRAVISDSTSEDYLSNVSIFNDATMEQCIEIIAQGKGANWMGEALSNVVVPEMPKIEEIAIDPDAPTLEELEKLDQLIEKTEQGYHSALQEYVQSREDVLKADLATKTIEELRESAKQEIVIILAIQTYIDTLVDEKTWRSVYQDEKYTLREFNNIEEFQNIASGLKEQLREEYRKLEAGFDDVKN